MNETCATRGPESTPQSIPNPANPASTGSASSGVLRTRAVTAVSRRVKTTAMVRVKVEGEAEGAPAVLNYHAPEQPLPDFDQHDFESKAPRSW